MHSNTPNFTHPEWIARALARAVLVASEKPQGREKENLLEHASAALGEKPKWLINLISPLATLPEPVWQQLDVDSLAARLRSASSFKQAFEKNPLPVVNQLFLPTAKMHPRPLGLDHLPLPTLATHIDLAQWLGITPDSLSWLATPSFRAGTPSVEHYRYRLLAKRTGGLRLLEVPKIQMRQAQRRLLDGLLTHVPAHEAAHGYVANRSVLSHAKLHTGQAIIIKFDLQDFFTSIKSAQIQAIWRSFGYPIGVASSLTTLCTHRTADMVIERLQEQGLSFTAGKRLAAAHLPQGAPTSPALSNLCAFSLDLRLAGLADRFGATYSRYADDLVFSGGKTLGRDFRSLQAWVGELVKDEGFALNPNKTRCIGEHQQQLITGVVVNQRINLARRDFDRFKAELYQSVMHGPPRLSHEKLVLYRQKLLGQINWIKQLNPEKANKLTRLFTVIAWPDHC